MIRHATLWPILGMTAALTAALVTQSAAQAPDPSGCTPQERANQTLSGQAGRNGGVICPPDVDPAMKAPTPDAGKTPIIPPPGSPGGDPNIRPK